MLNRCKICDSLYTEGSDNVCLDCIDEQILYLVKREKGREEEGRAGCRLADPAPPILD